MSSPYVTVIRISRRFAVAIVPYWRSLGAHGAPVPCSPPQARGAAIAAGQAMARAKGMEFRE